jgi:hypothetical protein
MSAPGLKLVSPPMRWIGHCHGCRRDDREVQTYYEHSAKTLCDACAERLNGKSVLGTRKQELGERGSRTTGSPKSLPTSSFLLPLSYFLFPNSRRSH